MARHTVSIGVRVPHIYSSVGYRIVYRYLGLSTTFLKIYEVSSTLSLFILNCSWGWGDLSKIMFAYNQALLEQSQNATIRDLVTKVSDKILQNQLSFDGMLNYLATLIAEREHILAKEKILMTGNHAYEVDWNKDDFMYYHMAYKIIAVEQYDYSEYYSMDEFNHEENVFKEKCKMAYNQLLNSTNNI